MLPTPASTHLWLALLGPIPEWASSHPWWFYGYTLIAFLIGCFLASFQRVSAPTFDRWWRFLWLSIKGVFAWCGSGLHYVGKNALKTWERSGSNNIQNTSVSDTASERPASYSQKQPEETSHAN